MSESRVTYRLFPNPVYNLASYRSHLDNEWGAQFVGLGDVLRSQDIFCPRHNHHEKVLPCCHKPFAYSTFRSSNWKYNEATKDRSDSGKNEVAREQRDETDEGSWGARHPIRDQSHVSYLPLRSATQTRQRDSPEHTGLTLACPVGPVCSSCMGECLKPEFQRVLHVDEAEHSGATPLNQLITRSEGCDFAKALADAILVSLGKLLYARCTPNGPKIEWKLKNKAGKLGILCRQPTIKRIISNNEKVEELTLEENEIEWAL